MFRSAAELRSRHTSRNWDADAIISYYSHPKRFTTLLYIRTDLIIFYVSNLSQYIIIDCLQCNHPCPSFVQLWTIARTKSQTIIFSQVLDSQIPSQATLWSTFGPSRRGLWSSQHPLCIKLAKNGRIWPKFDSIRSKTVSNVFHNLKNVKITEKHILWI
jgi:hypothetical protein